MPNKKQICTKHDNENNHTLKSSLIFIDDHKRMLTSSGKAYINYYMDLWLLSGKLEEINKFYERADAVVQAYIRNNYFMH